MSSPSPVVENNQMVNRVIAAVIGCLIALFIFKMLNNNKQENFTLSQNPKYIKCIDKCIQNAVKNKDKMKIAEESAKCPINCMR